MTLDQMTLDQMTLDSFLEHASTTVLESVEDLDIDDFLKQYGVKGMKWGVRKDRPGGRPIAGTDAAKRSTPSVRKKRQAKPRQKKPKDMTPDELRARINRLKLEKELRTLTETERAQNMASMKKVVRGSVESGVKTVATALVVLALSEAIKKGTGGKVNVAPKKKGS